MVVIISVIREELVTERMQGLIDELNHRKFPVCSGNVTVESEFERWNI
jgi:hypothetical protein